MFLKTISRLKMKCQHNLAGICVFYLTYTIVVANYGDKHSKHIETKHNFDHRLVVRHAKHIQPDTKISVKSLQAPSTSDGPVKTTYNHLNEDLLEIVINGDGGTPINSTNSFRNLCRNKGDGKRILVTIIDSAIGNFRTRNIIRNNWGSLDKYNEWWVRIFFLIGQSSHGLDTPGNSSTKFPWILNENQFILEESNKYGDIVMGNFTDTYKNLTYKHLMGYKFILQNCPEADLVIKTDDDIFVDIPKILDTRSHELALKAQNSSYKMTDIYCHHYHDKPTRCKRCPNGKWYSTRDEWPEETYPPYCLGGDNVITLPWLKKIYSVRHKGEFFWVDDVFILGRLREIAEKVYKMDGPANRLNIRANVTDRRRISTYVKDNCGSEVKEDKFGWFVLLRRTKPEFQFEMECLWQRVMRRVEQSDDSFITLKTFE